VEGCLCFIQVGLPIIKLPRGNLERKVAGNITRVENRDIK
jgi:hypothetical protein